MKPNDQRKLEVISGIDDKLLEKATAERLRLFGKRNKKRMGAWMPWVAMAASLAIVVGGVLAILPRLTPDTPRPPDDTTSVETSAPIVKQIPIYQGMTVSDTNPMAGNATATTTPDASPVSYSSGFAFPRMDLLTETKPTKPQPTPPHGAVTEAMTEAITEGDTDAVTEAMTEGVTDAPAHDFDPEAPMYYTKPNEDFYITVHISNPDNFEILSFTLNGTKYSTYMFEDGSDMENLILKCNVGDEELIAEFTIDAIKYIDGQEIKDVRMDGDQTILIGIYTEDQPDAAVTSQSAGIDHITVSGSLTDEMGLVAMSDGHFYAELFNVGEDTPLSRQPLTLGEDFTTTFEGLATGRTYVYRVMAEYDALDGTGFNTYVLTEQEVSTQAFAAFENVSVGSDSATFDLVWSAEVLEENKVSLVLYKGDEEVRQLDLTATAADGLLSRATYTLVASYRNGDAVETLSHTFTTSIKAAPSLSITAGEVTHSSLSFDFSLTDPDGIARVSKIELLPEDGQPIVAESIDVRSFENLFSGTKYTVRVTVIYDRNLGTGERTATESLEISTMAYKVPKITLDKNIAATTSSLQGAFSVKDTDSKALSVQAALYRGDQLIASAPDSPFSFEDLSAFTEYTVKVICTYDLLDGKGEQTAVAEKAVTTLPIFEIQELTIASSTPVALDSSIQFKATVSNPHGATVTSLVINGHTVPTQDLIPTQNQLHFTVTNQGQFGGGDISFAIEEVNVSCQGKTFTLKPQPVESAPITVSLGTAYMTYFGLANESFEPIDDRIIYHGQAPLLMLKLENPDGYEVERIEAYGVTANTKTWSKIDSETYVVCFGNPKSADHSDCPYVHVPQTYGQLYISVTSFTIQVGGITKTVLCSGDDSHFYVLRLAEGVKYISTPEELMDVDDHCYYELTQDIDLAGIEWKPVSLSGYLNGNGYAVKNLSIVEFIGAENDDLYGLYGLFSGVSGVLTDLHLESATIALNVSVPNGSMANPRMGLLSGHLVGGSTISNCSVDAASSLSVTMPKDDNIICLSLMGGLVGFCSGSTIRDCVFEGNIRCAGTPLCVGGILGDSNEASIFNCLYNGNIEILTGERGGYGIAGIMYENQNDLMTSCVNLKNLPLTNIAYCSAGGTLILQNNYALYKPWVEGKDPGGISLCTVAQLNDKSFWTDTLGWDEAIWCFDELDFENGKIPTLRRDHK